MFARRSIFASTIELRRSRAGKLSANPLLPETFLFSPTCAPPFRFFGDTRESVVLVVTSRRKRIDIEKRLVPSLASIVRTRSREGERTARSRDRSEDEARIEYPRWDRSVYGRSRFKDRIIYTHMIVVHLVIRVARGNCANLFIRSASLLAQSGVFNRFDRFPFHPLFVLILRIGRTSFASSLLSLLFLERNPRDAYKE